MDKINIPLKKRIIKIFLMTFAVFVFSIFYFLINIKTANNEKTIYKKRMNDWRKKTFIIRKKITNIEKEIQYKENKLKITFSDKEIDELANVYNSICKYMHEKYNINCALQGIEKDNTFINVIKVNIANLDNNFKNVIITANLLSYFTNKFIVSKTSIGIKKIKITGDNNIIIELYKRRTLK